MTADRVAPGPQGEVKRAMLRAHVPYSETTIHGKPAVVFGGVFVAAGAFIVLVACGVIPAEASSFHAPHWVVGVCGGIFALPGAWLMLHGAAGVRRQRRAESLRRRFPREPWLADHPWDRRGARDLQRRGVGHMLLGMAVVVLLAVPFNYIALAGIRHGSAMGYPFACVNVFVAIYAAAAGYRLVRWAKFGTARLHFRRFPFFLGEKLEVEYAAAHSLAGIERLTCTLRCVREAYESRGHDDPDRVVSYELHRESRNFDAGALSRSASECASLSFDLPADGLPTRLSERPPTYWELAVTGEARGVNLDSRFLVPVYAPASRT